MVPVADQNDVFQEVWATVTSKINAFTGEQFSGWLLSITKTRIADFYRRRRKEPLDHRETRQLEELTDNNPFNKFDQYEFNDDVPNPTYATLNEALRIVKAAVHENTFAAFERTAIHGAPANEVAKELNMSPSGVRLARSRVTKRLRDLMLR